MRRCGGGCSNPTSLPPFIGSRRRRPRKRRHGWPCRCNHRRSIVPGQGNPRRAQPVQRAWRRKPGKIRCNPDLSLLSPWRGKSITCVLSSFPPGPFISHKAPGDTPFRGVGPTLIYTLRSEDGPAAVVCVGGPARRGLRGVGQRPDMYTDDSRRTPDAADRFTPAFALRCGVPYTGNQRKTTQVGSERVY
jgi:hypothetical protein